MKTEASGTGKSCRSDAVQSGRAVLVLSFAIFLFMLLSACGASGGRSGSKDSSATVPVVTLHPADQTIAAGQTASFTIAASGNPTPTFQWERSADGSAFQGAAGATCSFTAQTADNGVRFRARDTNRAGTATSNAAILTCTPRAFFIGSTTRTFDGSPGSAGSIPVRIYYPAESNGADAPAVEGRFPLVLFSHGYQQAPLD